MSSKMSLLRRDSACERARKNNNIMMMVALLPPSQAVCTAATDRQQTATNQRSCSGRWFVVRCGSKICVFSRKVPTRTHINVGINSALVWDGRKENANRIQAVGCIALDIGRAAG